MTERGSFGPVVLAGLAAAGLLTLAATRPWLVAESPASGLSGYDSVLTVDLAPSSPVVTALALASLASWGAVLVTRSPVRRVVAGLGVLLGVAALLVTATAPATLRSAMADSLERAGTGFTVGDLDPGLTGWWWVALVGSVLVTVAAGAAIRLAPAWPEMGSRYDAPGQQRTRSSGDESLDLWRAMDEGEDPTA
ncbi:Trp biosynthesis-associated membrane protein [Nocardioides limicola]|uniref:Trp biosynthesis-associated membrane protein n=1 Tax=Nocardioides limicola TaxID=2803368 RepID=UPI00193C07E4|nr:Trp biosynthesis-associated membrane protein [Nocardioides sp. DJM-14]